MAQIIRLTVWRTRKDIYVNATAVRSIKATPKGGTEITFTKDSTLEVREEVADVARLLYGVRE